MIDIKRLLSSILDRCIITKEQNQNLYKFIQSADNESILIFVISFNRSDLLKNQFISLEKNLNNNFHLVICDNSTIEENAQKIEKTTLEINQTYLRLQSKTIFGPSFSHGLALNKARDYISSLNVKKDFIIGFLDHDIFLTKNYYLKYHISTTTTRLIGNKRKYMWPGLLFLPYSKFISRKPNFLPKFGFFFESRDTGIDVLYGEHLIALQTEKLLIEDKSDWTEMIDDAWLHLVNASQWREGPLKRFD